MSLQIICLKARGRGGTVSCTTYVLPTESTERGSGTSYEVDVRTRNSCERKAQALLSTFERESP